MINQKNALLVQCTHRELQQKLTGFPNRYQHYKPSKLNGIWEFNILSMDTNHITIQLIDKTFEPPRGEVASDQPYIYVDYHQYGENVKITYKLKWQKWKLLLIVISSVLFTSLITATIFLGKYFWLPIGLWICMLCIFVVWFAKNRYHDRLTIRVFEELLQKNFSSTCFYS